MEYIFWLENLAKYIKYGHPRFTSMDEDDIKDLVSSFVPRLFRIWLDFSPTPRELAEKLLSDDNFINFKLHDNVVYLNSYGSNNKISKK